MNTAELLLVGAVLAVGVLHTMVPDHWVPIALIAKQRHWSKSETARAALQAGVGHVLSTLLIGAVVWLAGVGVAAYYGHIADTLSSIALIAFGLWFAASAIREMRGAHAHSHAHEHEGHEHAHGEAHAHDHPHKTSKRTALLLILGSSPMIEGIPAFFAAGKYGPGLIIIMSVVFALSTIATYVVLCVYSAVGLQNTRFGFFEKYGEVLSGLFIALVGLVFWIWPVF